MKKILLSVSLLAFAAACGGDSSPTSPAVTKPAGPTFDDIGNIIDASVDADAEVMPLTVGGANGSTKLFVTPRNGDGKNGCNLTAGTTLTLSVTSSNMTVATVSLSPLTFTSCGDQLTLTVTPVGVGSATISVSQTSNNTGGTFNLAPALFTVNVSPPPNTAPTIDVAGVTGGAIYNKGFVPAVTCQVTDAEDGNSSFPATLSPIAGPYATDGIGLQTASCSYTDGGGLTVSKSETYSIVDPSAPSIDYTLNPTSPDGSNGWYKGDVTLTWTVKESESPSSLQKTGCADQNVTADQAATEYKCSATSAGGSAVEVSVSIKRDGNGPTITPADVINTTTWRNTDLSQAFAASDAPSGLANLADATFTLTASAQSANATTPTTVSKTVTDNAGNSTTRTVSGLIDKTKPTVSLVGGPAHLGSYVFGTVPNAPTCSASDGLSGLYGSCDVTGYSTAVGQHTVVATAKDNAGNTNTASAIYTVLPWTLKGFYAPVDMFDANNIQIVNAVRGGQTVPLKFNVYAGSTELTTTAAVQRFSALQIACTATATIDEIEEFSTTGGTSLRYDTTAGQFIQNWQTPKKVGECYRVTVFMADGFSSITALFKLK